MGDPAGIGPEIIIKSLSKPGLLVPRWWWWAVCARCDVYGDEYHAAGRVMRHSKGVRPHFAPGVINVMDEPLANPDA